MPGEWDQVDVKANKEKMVKTWSTAGFLEVEQRGQRARRVERRCLMWIADKGLVPMFDVGWKGVEEYENSTTPHPRFVESGGRETGFSYPEVLDEREEETKGKRKKTCGVGVGDRRGDATVILVVWSLRTRLVTSP